MSELGPAIGYLSDSCGVHPAIDARPDKLSPFGLFYLILDYMYKPSMVPATSYSSTHHIITSE